MSNKSLVNNYENFGMDFIKDDFWRRDAESIAEHYRLKNEKELKMTSMGEATPEQVSKIESIDLLGTTFYREDLIIKLKDKYSE